MAYSLKCRLETTMSGMTYELTAATKGMSVNVHLLGSGDAW